MRSKIILTLAVALFIFVVMYSAAPLFGNRYIPTHDGEYHIIRIAEFSLMLSAGYMFPRWAPTLNSGYGVPIFQFHYPFPNYAGSFVRYFTRDSVYAFQVSSAAAYTFFALAIVLWLTSLFPVIPAMLGGVVGIVTPYIFLDMYIRGSVGEIWAMAFLCAVLYSLERKKYIFAAFFYAAIILSHNISAMLYTPFIIFYELVRGRRSWWFLLGGLGLSAYFWLPAIAEKKYVVGLNTVNFRDHFVQLYELLIPSWGSELSASGSLGNKMSFQIGIVPMLSMLLGLSRSINAPSGPFRRLILFLLLWMFLCVVFMLSASTMIWNFITPMQYIQYPWRLLSFVSIVSAASASYWMHGTKKIWPGFVIAILAVFTTVGYSRPVSYEPRNEAYYLSKSNFTDGTSSMGNSFSTVWTPWKKQKSTSRIVVQNGKVAQTHISQYLHTKITVQMDAGGEVLFHTLYFPGWIARMDQKIVPISYAKDGIIHVPVPKGTHTVSIQYEETFIRKVADSVSIASFLVVMIWSILPLYEYRHRRVTS